MAVGGDQPKQMLDWVKRVEKVGYIVETDKFLYKIRDPKTRGLILTAPMYPRGNQVLRDTMARARKNGIDVERLEAAQRTIKRLNVGAPPPPVASPLPPEQARMAAEHEARMREQQAKKEEQVTEPKAAPVRKGRGPTTPAKIEATKRAAALVKRALNVMGGDTTANRMRLWEFGKDLAIKKGRRYPADSAGKPVEAVKAHMKGLLSDAPGGMYGWIDEFWTITANAAIKEFADEIEETVTPAAREAEEIVAEVFEDTATKTGQDEEMFALRQSVEALTEDLANEREAHKATYARYGKELAEARQRIAELERELDARPTVEHAQNGHNGVIADELSIVVLRRMLLKEFPNGEDVINEAIDFAAEVVRRVA